MSIKFGQKVIYSLQEDDDPDQCPPVDQAGVVVGSGSGYCDDCEEKHTWAVVFYENDPTPWTLEVSDLEVVQ